MLSQILVDSQEEGMSEGPWSVDCEVEGMSREIGNDYNRIGPAMISS